MVARLQLFRIGEHHDASRFGQQRANGRIAVGTLGLHDQRFARNIGNHQLQRPATPPAIELTMHPVPMFGRWSTVFSGNQPVASAVVVVCCNEIDIGPRAVDRNRPTCRVSMSIKRPRYTVLPAPLAPMTAINCGCLFDDSELWASDIGAEQLRQRAAEQQFSWSHTKQAIGAACSASKYVSSGICAR